MDLYNYSIKKRRPQLQRSYTDGHEQVGGSSASLRRGTAAGYHDSYNFPRSGASATLLAGGAVGISDGNNGGGKNTSGTRKQLKKSVTVYGASSSSSSSNYNALFSAPRNNVPRNINHASDGPEAAVISSVHTRWSDHLQDEHQVEQGRAHIGGESGGLLHNPAKSTTGSAQEVVGDHSNNFGAAPFIPQRTSMLSKEHDLKGVRIEPNENSNCSSPAEHNTKMNEVGVMVGCGPATSSSSAGHHHTAGGGSSSAGGTTGGQPSHRQHHGNKSTNISTMNTVSSSTAAEQSTRCCTRGGAMSPLLLEEMRSPAANRLDWSSTRKNLQSGFKNANNATTSARNNHSNTGLLHASSSSGKKRSKKTGGGGQQNYQKMGMNNNDNPYFSAVFGTPNGSAGTGTGTATQNGRGGLGTNKINAATGMLSTVNEDQQLLNHSAVFLEDGAAHHHRGNHQVEEPNQFSPVRPLQFEQIPRSDDESVSLSAQERQAGGAGRNKSRRSSQGDAADRDYFRKIKDRGSYSYGGSSSSSARIWFSPGQRGDEGGSSGAKKVELEDFGSAVFHDRKQQEHNELHTAARANAKPMGDSEHDFLRRKPKAAWEDQFLNGNGVAQGTQRGDDQLARTASQHSTSQSRAVSATASQHQQHAEAADNLQRTTSAPSAKTKKTVSIKLPDELYRSALNPAKPPLHAQQPNFSDRFIPSRRETDLRTGLLVMDEQVDSNQNSHQPTQALDSAQDENTRAYTNLLKSELLGLPQAQSCLTGDYGPVSNVNPSELPGNLFKFKSAPQLRCDDAFSLSTVLFHTDTSQAAPRKPPRKIAKVPYKVLDAPQLQDDFYLNLVDWSSTNCLSVGLSNCVYLWSACTSRVTKLCEQQGDSVTSVSWTQRGTHLAVGTNRGEVQIWDVGAGRKLRTMGGHKGRVGSMAWNGYVLSTGSRDHQILHRDVRQQVHYMARLQGHKQEVCGLKWSFDDGQLASGGNDNKLLIWNLRSTSPVLKFTEHQAAVKALAWSPHQHGLLCSGGGTADRCIRFWNTVNNTNLSSIDTGSQVCNLSWSTSVNEIVSTHGYSLNQIIVWKYPSMRKVVTLTGHTYRVLYLALSPDGQSIVTGAGDETLRFWNVFPGSSGRSNGNQLLSLPFSTTIR
ncbi:unnamed protein product [Amoebophrya sp. A120]|nr:unnamed protein product [Amoebophrya sp. A120]|eukprot:GSA120T00005816001.1